MNACLNHLQNHISDAKLKKMYEIYKESYNEHYTAAGFYESIGGQVGEDAAANPGNYVNTCAARLSKALNYGGYEIPGGTPNTFKGGDGKAYFIRASDMKAYLSNRKVWGNPIPVKSGVAMRNGVIFQDGFGGGVTGHLDIIYRSIPAHKMHSNKSTYYWH